MKKKLLPLAALLVSGMVYSQVGIGTHYPNKSSQLDIKSDDKGVLIPRIALTSVTDASTIANGNVESLLVYNITSNAEMQPGYFYWFRNRWTRMISDEDTTLFLNTSNVKLSVINGQLVLEDTEGHIVSVLLSDISKPETVTTLVKDATTGVYTYTNEAGDTVDITVISDVTNKFEEIINNTTVQDILNQYITKIEGNVTYDGTNFNYYDDKGVLQIINITDLVKAAETLTTIEQNATTRVYTYTNEAGATVDINVIADVTNKFEEIINNTVVKEILNQYITKIEGNVTYDGTNFNYYDDKGVLQIINITDLVKAAETLTTIEQNATTRVYTYT
ncbi:DNA-binding IscR family transcriptional regulator, partial [Flavobacterium sp. HSC-61S13]|nr:DNA-binding IscR family transcriptional regulator [Flavobacterium sp. HSC-61S13]